MSTVVFPFRIAYSRSEIPAEGPEPRQVGNPAQSGIERVRGEDPEGVARFVMAGKVRLNGESGHSYKDWLDFYAARNWGADTFLYKSKLAAHRQIQGEAAGTAAGGAGETFYLDKKFIDADTLVVKVAGTPTAPANYELKDNNTAPYIETKAGFPAGAVTFDYEYYHQVYLASVGAPVIRTRDKHLDAQGAIDIAVTMREKRVGGHLA